MAAARIAGEAGGSLHGATSPVPPQGRARGREIHPWRVLHACERARDVLTVLEIQAAAGMRPALVMLAEADASSQGGGEARSARSLLAAWQEVRNWRRSMIEADPWWTCDVIHAHSFPSGMAAVRNCPVTVYDVTEFVEEIAAQSGQTEGNSWLARSFRVAEQFVLARAGAVVVHTPEAHAGALRRGTHAESVFLIDPLLPPAQAAELYNEVYQYAVARKRSGNSDLKPHGLRPVTAMT